MSKPHEPRRDARFEIRLARGPVPDLAVRIAVLSDVHVHHRENYDRLPVLAAQIHDLGCDVVVLAGDVSHRLEEVNVCLERLAVAREHVFVPGNHDLWPVDEGSPGSRERHEHLLPTLCRERGWKYLPHEGPARFGFATFFGVTAWPDGSLVGAALEEAGTCEWEPREPDSSLAMEDADRLRAELGRYQAHQNQDDALVLVTHFVASERSKGLVEQKGKAVGSNDGQALLERAWLPAVADGSIHGPPDLVIHGHKHTRYFAGDAACWALGYPWQAAALASSGDSHFAALDLIRVAS